MNRKDYPIKFYNQSLDAKGYKDVNVNVSTNPICQPSCVEC